MEGLYLLYLADIPTTPPLFSSFGILGNTVSGELSSSDASSASFLFCFLLLVTPFPHEIYFFFSFSLLKLSTLLIKVIPEKLIYIIPF